MNYSDDGYAAMLLTMALSPDREEYARPYSVQEFHRLEAAVRGTDVRRLGRLLNEDISGLMMRLGMSEEEAYRAFTLLHRSVQLSYALEGFERQAIRVVTCFDPDYPQRLTHKLRDMAPAFYYVCGREALLTKPAIAIVGISGVKTTPEVRDGIESIVREAVEQGYAIVTGGELGVSRVAAGVARDCGGCLLDVLGGGLLEHIHRDGIAEMIAMDRCAAVSLEHPEAMFTVSHAIARNKLLFSLADAAFIFNTDGRRGEIDILENRYCDWVYAWEGCRENRALFAHGANPLKSLDKLDLREMSRHWESSRSEQLNMFDLF